MANPPSSPRGAGFLIALSLAIGTGIGIAYGQPTIGLLAGVAAGVLIAVVLWLADRR